MNTFLKRTAVAALCGSMVIMTGCASVAATGDSNAAETRSISVGNSTSNSSQLQLEQRAMELDAREAELNARANVAVGGDLLPPKAAPGECYARVWVDAQYRTDTEQVQLAEASTSIAVIPARYEVVSETMEVSAASSRLETIPAVYGTEVETIKISDGIRTWRTENNLKAAPANEGVLAAAAAHGIDLESAAPGMCFHEHYTPAQYKTVTEQVLTKAATETVNIVPASYQMVDKQVLVKEQSTRLIEVPAQYEMISEQIIDKQAHTVWKKGTGPIQRMDEATGEIMCLVEVPATYKTISRRVLKSAASTTSEVIPAVYETVSVRQLVSAASEQRTPIAEEYSSVERTELSSAAEFVWHDVANLDHPKSTRTGNKICLTESEPRYRKVERTVVTTPAQTRTIDIPAQFKTVEVTKLVSPASEDVTVIPAKFGTIDKRTLVKDGYMDWRSILCDTNMTTSRIADIQRALQNAGYEIGVGGVDGVIGRSTINAVNAFQTDKGLPVDKYLNIATIEALGVSVK